MKIFFVVLLGTLRILQCSDENSMNQDDSSDLVYQYMDEHISQSVEEGTQTTEQASIEYRSTEPNVQRRYWLVTSKFDVPGAHDIPSDKDEAEKDAHLKSKIATLVEQTIHDTERKLRSIQRLKDKHKDEAPYKIGFILSLVKKSKDVLNELFNVAVKHRDDYKALEQLKIFEYIVHTNVDTTNLVRQMVEIHIYHMNATNTIQQRNRVVFL